MASEQQKQGMAKALLEDPQIQPAPEDREGAWPSPLTIVSFVILTFSSTMAMSSRRRGYSGAVSFMAFSCSLDLVLLLYCLRMYRKTPPGSPRREDLKVAMCILTTMLTIAIFQILEFWFLTIGITENSITDFRNGPTRPDQHLYPPTIP